MAANLFTRGLKLTVSGSLGGFAVIAATGLLLLLPVGDGLARWSYDLAFFWRGREVPEEIAMIYLDPRIKAELGQPVDEPLDRSFYTRVLERLTDDGARMVIFDILFDAPHRDPAVDRAFAEAMRRHGRVVLAGYMVRQFESSIVTTAPMPPEEPLATACAAWGLAEVSPDASDQTVRRLDTGGEQIASISWAAASVLDAPVTREENLRHAERWMNYYCEPALLPAVNLDRVIAPDGVPAGAFSNKIVIVGVRPGGGGIAGAEREEFPTPWSRFGGANASGPAIHAMSLLNLLRGDWLVRPSIGAHAVLVVLWAVALALGLFRLKPLAAGLAAAGVLVAWAVVAVVLQSQFQLWHAWLIPAAAQTGVALVWAVGYQYAIESRRRRKLRQAFAAYLSPYMADRIAESDFDLTLGGKEVEATIMFTDLEGFTTMSEELSPSEVSRILVEYFSTTTKAILDQEGTVIKYIGDAVMAVWGAPMSHPSPAERSVLAAVDIQRTNRTEVAGRSLRTRIGVNTGKVLAGNLGSEFRFDYTLIGAATNAASRLEGLNKYLGTDLLISGSTAAGLGDKFVTRFTGRFILSGTSKPMEAHEVLGRVDQFDGRPAWLAEFAGALDRYNQRDLDGAEAGFRRVKELRDGVDGPSEFYLKRIAIARESVDDGRPWDGVVSLKEK